MGSFEIHPAKVPEGINHYSFVAGARDIDLSASFPSDITVEADLERRGRQFLVSADVRTFGHFTCDRCLTTFDLEMDGSFRVLFVPEGASVSSREQDDEVRTIPSDLMLIVLDEDVRQCIELAVPFKLLCSDTCKGLCPQCGKNLNDGPCTCERDDMDPRWEPLRKLSRS